MELSISEFSKIVHAIVVILACRIVFVFPKSSDAVLPKLSDIHRAVCKRKSSLTMFQPIIILSLVRGSLESLFLLVVKFGWLVLIEILTRSPIFSPNLLSESMGFIGLPWAYVDRARNFIKFLWTSLMQLPNTLKKGKKSSMAFSRIVDSLTIIVIPVFECQSSSSMCLVIFSFPIIDWVIAKFLHTFTLPHWIVDQLSFVKF